MSHLLYPVAFDTITLNLLKSGNDTAKNISLVSGALAYHHVGKAMDTHPLSTLNGSWNVGSTITNTLAGHFIWQEQLDTKKIIGISLGIIALYLMNDT